MGYVSVISIWPISIQGWSLLWVYQVCKQWICTDREISSSSVSRFSLAWHCRSGWQLTRSLYTQVALQWRHNGHDSVSNHQPHHCLLSGLFRHRSKKTSKLRVTGLCAGNSPGTGEFPAQMASYAENVPIWWRYHGCISSRKSGTSVLFQSTDLLLGNGYPL